jgi:hypothetical protein
MLLVSQLCQDYYSPSYRGNIAGRREEWSCILECIRLMVPSTSAGIWMTESLIRVDNGDHVPVELLLIDLL